MASLEAQINQYTIEIKEKEAEIKDLRLQKRRLADANEKKELKHDIPSGARGPQSRAAEAAQGFAGQVAGCVCVCVISIHTHRHTRCFLHFSRLFAQSVWRSW